MKICLEERVSTEDEYGILFCGSCINTSVDRLRELARVYVDSVAQNWVDNERTRG